MPLTLERALAAISAHSHGLADDARGNLSARVEHCPDWNVADLVWHVTEVHWFWRTIAGERLPEPADESRRPVRPADDDLLETFLSGAEELVETLRTADQSAACWTWFPPQQDVAFITRHQVQEAAVHHWDAVHAAGDELVIGTAVAADSVDEFLAFSVASEDDPDDPPEGTLDGAFTLVATDSGDRWALSDGSRPGTVHVERGGTDGPVVEASAADLLLWLYGRVELDTSAVPAELLARFRALCFTD